jgi:hypothetical protein
LRPEEAEQWETLAANWGSIAAAAPRLQSCSRIIPPRRLRFQEPGERSLPALQGPRVIAALLGPSRPGDGRSFGRSPGAGQLRSPPPFGALSRAQDYERMGAVSPRHPAACRLTRRPLHRRGQNRRKWRWRIWRRERGAWIGRSLSGRRQRQGPPGRRDGGSSADQLPADDGRDAPRGSTAPWNGSG